MRILCTVLAALSIAAPVGAQEPTRAELCAAAEPLWETEHKVDAITDARQCTVSLVNPAWSRAGGVFFIAREGRATFMVMGDRFPGEESAIRVDKNKARIFREQLTGPAARALIAELAEGEHVTTRYIEWPSGAPMTAVNQICDLPEKIRECLDAVN